MPDPALSAAIQEAYASAPAEEVIYHTLELWHTAFSAPIRVVRDIADLDARLEPEAARNPGEVVTFVGYSFDLVPPDQSTTAVPQCTIEIDNVDRLILGELDKAAVSGEATIAIYRAFLASALDDGPENQPPMVLTLFQVSATPFRITATAGFPDLVNRRFPRLDYSPERFPGLVT